MTWRACAAEAELQPHQGADGSFSLFSARFGEGFHGPIGALREASRERGLELEIWGLELDPTPLRRALAAPTFRCQWQPATLALLDTLLEQGRCGASQLLWGDARQRVGELPAGSCDLVLLDGFSPQRCPELWTLEFLAALARLLKPEGRLLSYCCAAAVRRALQRVGLKLASIQPTDPLPRSGGSHPWSFGTAASPDPLPVGAGPLRELTAMELEHLATRAAEPYRDPSGRSSAAEILAARQRAQASSAGSTSAWRRRWGLDRSKTGTDGPA